VKKPLLLFQMGSELRQFGHSGFIDLLIEKGSEVIVASRHYTEDLSSELNPLVQYVPLPKSTPNFLYEQLAVVLDQAQTRWRLQAGKGTWRYGSPTSKNFKQRLRRQVQHILSAVLANRTAFRSAVIVERYMVRSVGASQWNTFLDHHRPDAVITSLPRLNYQAFLLSAAEQRGIPTFLFFHTNKDVVAFSRLDHKFTAIGVWNTWMKEQLLLQNPDLDAQTIVVTGCSHFDCVNRAEWLIPEQKFRQLIGVGAQERLVVYTAAGPGLVPAEERYIGAVVEVLDSLETFDVRLVVRLNPMDDRPNVASKLRDKYPGIVILQPDWYYSRQHNFCYQRKRDVMFFNSLLHYAEVCINIPSTVTVECAIAGVPIVNLGFDLPGPSPLPGSIHAFWDADYYTNVRKSGAALDATDIATLAFQMKASLQSKQLLQCQQKNLIDLELNGRNPEMAHRAYLQVVGNH
jgi:hypothetical protein